MKKKVLKVLSGIILIFIVGLIGFVVYISIQMNKLRGMTFEESFAYTLKDNKNAVVTIGIYKNGESSYEVYGKDGQKLEKEPHVYEIGSLTKTMTAALIARAINEGRISLKARIDEYLDLPKDRIYPTIHQLLTHTSGYKSYYYELPMMGNFFMGRNSFFGIKDSMVLYKLSSKKVSGKKERFEYSNFGYTVLGLVLESVYSKEYTDLLNNYLNKDLGLAGTQVSEGKGDLKNYWNWQVGDAYIPAGGVISNIEDMLSYLKMQINEVGEFSQCHKVLEKIDTVNAQHQKMGIHTDEIGMAWILDTYNGFVWHNGGTGGFQSYLAFHPQSKTGIVILSNLSPKVRIPATVYGVKLLQELVSSK